VEHDVAVAVAGDFEALFRSVFPRLVSLGAIKTGRIDIARELAQETMLRAHARWDDITTYESPEAWCHVVMTNLLIDHHRSTTSERRAAEHVGRRADESSPAPTLDRWNELVEPLPDRQRLIVTLYYGEDSSVTEIAESLGISAGAVRAALFKARRTLRRRLEEEQERE
jgi:RNA polymerase sigma-70 factor (ECF subfamily)